MAFSVAGDSAFIGKLFRSYRYAHYLLKRALLLAATFSPRFSGVRVFLASLRCWMLRVAR